MKRKLAPGIAVAISVLVLLTSCDLNFNIDAPTSSLNITAATVYDSSNNVLIQFSFTGEENKHLCQYSIAKNGGTSFSVVEEGEEELLAGEVYDRVYDISPYGDGHYRFSFAVLLERNGSYDSPPFLQDSVYFWIDPTGPSGDVTIDPIGGFYSSAQQVVLDHPEIDAIDGSPARIFYTTDGSVPTSASTQYDPGHPISVSANTTLKAIAIDMADRTSSISEEVYEIDIQAPVQPVLNPGPGTYGVNIVDLTHPEYPTSAGGTPVTLYYTLDGTSPDASSIEYSGMAITFPDDGDWQVRAIAIDGAGNTSTELIANYVIDTSQPAPPTLDHSTGEYNTSFNLAIFHSEIPTPTGTDVQIYYTMGSISLPSDDPNSGSNLYTTAVPIDRNRVVKAIAIDEVGNASSIVTREYTFLRIDSVTPASCSQSTPINTIDIGGFFFDKSATNIGISVSDGVMQEQCFLDEGVSSISNLHIIILDTYIAGMGTGLGTLSVVNLSNGDTVTTPITIDP